MRKLCCYQASGENAQAVLDEFTAKYQKLGVTEADIVSVNIFPPIVIIKTQSLRGNVDPQVEVAIVFWYDGK